MTRLTLIIRAALYGGSLAVYVLLAAWVGQDGWSLAGRVFAAGIGTFWMFLTAVVVETQDWRTNKALPDDIAESLLNDGKDEADDR